MCLEFSYPAFSSVSSPHSLSVLSYSPFFSLSILSSLSFSFSSHSYFLTTLLSSLSFPLIFPLIFFLFFTCPFSPLIFHCLIFSFFPFLYSLCSAHSYFLYSSFLLSYSRSLLTLFSFFLSSPLSFSSFNCSSFFILAPMV